MGVCMYVCIYMRYLDRLALFSFELAQMGGCTNNDKARTRYRYVPYSLQEVSPLIASTEKMQETGLQFIVLIREY